MGSLKHVCLIFLFSFVLISPILFLGIPDNYDVMEHMRFAVTYSDSFSNGQILPLWSEKDNSGFGGAGVRLYPPLTYILFSSIHLVTSSWHLSLSAVLIIGMFIGCVGVYFFTKEFYPNGYPLLASLFYAVIPYHLFQIYQVFLLAEFMAAAFSPFVFYFGTKLVRDGGIRNSLLFAIFFSLVILSHIPSTIILSISLTIFLAFQLEKSTFLRTALYTSISAIVTLCATSFYWLKVISEAKWVKVDDVEFFNRGLYTYSAYLFPIFLDPPSFYQLKLLWLYDITIALLLLISLFLSAFLISKRKFDRLSASILVTAGVAVLMTTIISRPIWDSIELLQKLQFPWRWLSIGMLMISLLAAVFISTIREQKEKLSRFVIYPFSLIALVTSLFVITQILIPMAPLAPEKFNTEVDELGTTNGCRCWWPVWAKSEIFTNSERVSTHGRIVVPIKLDGDDKRFSVEAGAEQNARIAVFYYPYWQAEVNGQPTPIEIGDDGSINIPLPEESAEVRLHFNEPDFLGVARYVSLFAWIILLGSLCGLLFTGYGRRLSTNQQS